MTSAEETEIRVAVCDTIAAAIERDISGDEQIMKEVWERCDEAETKIAEKEMQAIVDMIRGRIINMQKVAAKTGDCPSDCNCRGEAGDR